MTTPKILMPIGDAAEVMDTLYASYRLKEAGYEVVVAGPDARVDSPWTTPSDVAHRLPTIAWTTARLAPTVPHRSLDNSAASQANLVRGGKWIRGWPSGREPQGGVIHNSTGYEEKSNTDYYLYLKDRPVASRRPKKRLLQRARFNLI